MEMPAGTCGHRGVSLMAPETPKHAWQSQARLQEGNSKSTTSAPSQRAVEESPSPILGEEGRDPVLQGQCRQVICQLDAITVAPSSVKSAPSKSGAKEGELKPSATWDLAIPTPMSPDFLQFAMDQCGLKLNEQHQKPM